MGGLEDIMRNNFNKVERTLRKELKSVTELLSSLCQYIEGTNQKSILKKIDDGALDKWWQGFKETETKRKLNKIERERIKASFEQKEREKLAIREKVLKKLTPEEKKILGVR